MGLEIYLSLRNICLLAIQPHAAAASPEYFAEFSGRERFKLYF